MRKFLLDREAFDAAGARAESAVRAGIGTLGEKLLHAQLKEYYRAEDGALEEPVGRYVADVKNGGSVVEIQTGGCAVIADKLRDLIKEYEVTLVLPVMRAKRLIWIDRESGEATKARRSPKTGRPGDVLPELLYIEDLLDDPRFRVQIFLYDGIEQRYLDGWGNGGKRGAHRAQRIPETPVEICEIEGKKDLAELLPAGLPKEFTTIEFARATGFRGRRLWAAQKLLTGSGTLSRRKEGRVYLYTLGKGE